MTEENSISSGSSGGDLSLWAARKTQLADVGTEELWGQTFNEFLMYRLETRYLHPIKILQDHNVNKGEGFTIVSIQCALIEFLAALRKGLNYNLSARGEYEYSRSADIFTSFLTDAEPFKSSFNNDDSAIDFYKNVRCALLHEACTKDGWLIKAQKTMTDSIAAVDVSKKIVWRNNLNDVIKEYLVSYGIELRTDHQLQAAFIRKFDHLATVS